MDTPDPLVALQSHTHLAIRGFPSASVEYNSLTIKMY